MPGILVIERKLTLYVGKEGTEPGSSVDHERELRGLPNAPGQGSGRKARYVETRKRIVAVPSERMGRVRTRRVTRS